MFQDYTAADAIMAGALVAADPHVEFSGRIEALRALPSVEIAEVERSILYVKFRHGGYMLWDATPSSPNPPPTLYADPERSLLKMTGDVVGNRNVLFVSPITDSEPGLHAATLAAIGAMTPRLTEAGFTVNPTVWGTSADVEFFTSGMRGYGLLFISAHGSFFAESSRKYIRTGELAPWLTEVTHDPAWPQWYLDWISSRLVPSYRRELENGVPVAVRRWCVSDQLIRERYAPGSMPHSLVLLAPCYMFDGSSPEVQNAMAEAFVQAGAAAVVGWESVNRYGCHAAQSIVANMLDGMNLGEALDVYPFRVDHWCNNIGCYDAALHLHPDPAGRTLLLVSDETPEFAGYLRGVVVSDSISYEFDFPGQTIAPHFVGVFPGENQILFTVEAQDMFNVVPVMNAATAVLEFDNERQLQNLTFRFGLDGGGGNPDMNFDRPWAALSGAIEVLDMTPRPEYGLVQGTFNSGTTGNSVQGEFQMRVILDK